MHIHHRQDEHLTVVQGKMGAQVLGEAPQYFGVGEGATFKSGVSHKFWNAGNEPLICTGWVKPAHNLEYFLTEIDVRHKVVTPISALKMYPKFIEILTDSLVFP